MNHNTNTLYKPLDITRNQNNEPTAYFTHRHYKYLKLLGELRDKSFETLWYDKETTAYNQSSNSVHIKGSKGELILIEYTDGTIDIMPKEDGDDGYDLQAIILAANYPEHPVTIDVKAASWGGATQWQPELLVRVDTEPSADYYVNVSLDDSNGNKNSQATIHGIASNDTLYGNDISTDEAVENLLEQYHDMSDYKQDALADEWGDYANAEVEITHLVEKNAKKGRRITDTLHLSHFNILNYCVEYEDLDEIPDARDFHPVEEPEPDHRTANLNELLDDLEQKNKQRTESPETTTNPDNNNTGNDPDRYVNGTPIYNVN